MKYTFKLLFLLLFLCCLTEVKAETWNEPWQKEIIQQSNLFILGEVTEVDGLTAKVKVLKRIGGTHTKKEITIDGFFLLTLTSSSGHGVHLSLEVGNNYYLFLKENENGSYSLPTPTSGYAYLDKEIGVVATYRHSYHQALISQEIYEMTFENIWSYYKKGTFQKDINNNYINSQLDIKPASFDNEDEINIFFKQHVALETAYLLDLSFDVEKIKKFVLCDNFHLKVSALQLLGNIDTNPSKELLLSSIESEDYTNFEKVIAIWSLKRLGDKNYISMLKKMKDKLSDEVDGFGGNIMDPRVGTHFPSPKGAVEKL